MNSTLCMNWKTYTKIIIAPDKSIQQTHYLPTGPATSWSLLLGTTFAHLSQCEEPAPHLPASSFDLERRIASLCCVVHWRAVLPHLKILTLGSVEWKSSSSTAVDTDFRRMVTLPFAVSVNMPEVLRKRKTRVQRNQDKTQHDTYQLAALLETLESTTLWSLSYFLSANENIQRWIFCFAKLYTKPINYIIHIWFLLPLYVFCSPYAVASLYTCLYRQSVMWVPMCTSQCRVCACM